MLHEPAHGIAAQKRIQGRQVLYTAALIQLMIHDFVQRFFFKKGCETSKGMQVYVFYFFVRFWTAFVR